MLKKPQNMLKTALVKLRKYKIPLWKYAELSWLGIYCVIDFPYHFPRLTYSRCRSRWAWAPSSRGLTGQSSSWIWCPCPTAWWRAPGTSLPRCPSRHPSPCSGNSPGAESRCPSSTRCGGERARRCLALQGWSLCLERWGKKKKIKSFKKLGDLFLAWKYQTFFNFVPFCSILVYVRILNHLLKSLVHLSSKT